MQEEEGRYLALWAAVLARAYQDVKANRRDAIEWIGTRDFRSVCELAGLDAEQVQSGLIEAIPNKFPRNTRERLSVSVEPTTILTVPLTHQGQGVETLIV